MCNVIKAYTILPEVCHVCGIPGTIPTHVIVYLFQKKRRVISGVSKVYAVIALYVYIGMKMPVFLY